MSRGRTLLPILATLAAGPALPGAAGCAPPPEPPPYEVVVLRGTPYERGHQHGQRLASKIRSLYTQLLTSSLLPYFNRLRPDIADLLWVYQDARYEDGQFSYRVMLESAEHLAAGWIPPDYLAELRGVADGAGVPYEQILILNTFADTLLALRSVAFFIDQLQAPRLRSLAIVGGLAGDGLDNDGDGATDEPGEGLQEPYEPLAHAAFVGVPPGAGLRFVFSDPQGVDPATLRVQHDRRVYQAPDPALVARALDADGTTLELLFTPPDGLPPASATALLVMAGDRSLVTEPPPSHARFMRPERITLGTLGLAARPHELPNRGEDDGRSQPPSLGVGLRHSATADGQPLLGHHFAMLDVNSAHKHAVLFVHQPLTGPSFVVPGWAGLIGSFSGMNSAGLAYLANIGDTMDNPIMGQFVANLIFARLLSSGVPIGVLGRLLLEGSTTVDEARALLASQPASFGWNLLLADAAGGLRAVELDSDATGSGPLACSYTPDDAGSDGRDAWGRPWGSLGPDDLRLASQFGCNHDDIWAEVQGLQIRPQRYWSSYYFRSVRAFWLLGQHLADGLGAWDAAGLAALLATPALADQRDSMYAVVFEPAAGRLRLAAGTVPATAEGFATHTLADLLAAEGR